MSAIQDDASKGTITEETKEPWWVHNWYWPGVWLGLVAVIAMGYAPWTEGSNPGRFVGSGVALLVIAAGLTSLYGWKSMDYGVMEKKISEAERKVYNEWHQEQVYEHCHEDCSCSFCRNLRYQKRQAITGK